MKCPICHQDSSASLTYCEFCGAELDRDFSQVAVDLVRETEHEKEEKIEEEIRNFMVLSIFLVIMSVTIYAIIPDPPQVNDPPAYFHEVKKKEKVKIDFPLLEAKIPE